MSKKKKGADVSDETMPLAVARDTLARIWFLGAIPSFVVLMVLTLMGRFKDLAQDAWSWYLPTTLPTLLLILGVLAATAFGPKDERLVRTQFYGFAKWLSVFYVAIVVVTVTCWPLTGNEPLEAFRLANFFLPPLQGLAAGAIGALFTKQEKDDVATNSVA